MKTSLFFAHAFSILAPLLLVTFLIECTSPQERVASGRLIDDQKPQTSAIASYDTPEARRCAAIEAGWIDASIATRMPPCPTP